MPPSFSESNFKDKPWYIHDQGWRRVCRAGPSNTEILVDSSSEDGVRYGRDVKCTLGAIDYRIPYRKCYGAGNMPKEDGRFRFEAQTAMSVLREKDSPVTAGWQAILSRRPDAKWVTLAPFKRSIRDGDDAQTGFDEPAEEFKEILERIDRLTFDPWETGDYLTSGIFVPPRLFDDDVWNYSGGEWFISACECFDECMKRLDESDQSKELRSLTKNGTLAIGYDAAPREYKKLHQYTIEEGNSLLYMAIKQAIAGAVRDENDNSDSLMDQATKLYKNHMFTKNCEVIKRHNKHTP